MGGVGVVKMWHLLHCQVALLQMALQGSRISPCQNSLFLPLLLYAPGTIPHDLVVQKGLLSLEMVLLVVLLMKSLYGMTHQLQPPTGLKTNILLVLPGDGP